MTVTDDIASLEAVPDVHVPLVMTAADPVLHGAGSSGNTQRLRTQDIMLPDGRTARVPFVSGNSLRHSLRAAIAWHFVRLLDVPYGSLPKAAADLLWSGGSLSASGGSTDLELARRVHARLPFLGLLGYSARNDIKAGTLAVDNVHLLCAENQWRLPESLKGHPHASLPARGARGEEFGTRHDIAGSAADRYIAAAGGEVLPTVQMIYDAQVIKPGAVLWTAVHLHAPSPGHVAALAAALDEAAPVRDGCRRVVLGGKRSAGYGTCLIDGDAVLGGAGTVTELKRSYEAHLLAHRDEALALLAEVTG